MKCQFKYYSLFILYLLASYAKSHSQGISQISDKKLLTHLIKAYSLNYNDNAFLTEYLRRTDKNYNSYKNNEIDFSHNIQRAEMEIRNSLTSVNYNEIYISEMRSFFEDYDLNTNCFKFHPLEEHDHALHLDEELEFSYSQVLNTNYNCNNHCENVFCGVHLYPKNYDDFKNLCVSENVANYLLKRKNENSFWGSDNTNRKVYLRCYYSLLDEQKAY